MALLDRVLQRGPASAGSRSLVDDSRMTVIEHLEALRRVLVVVLVSWTVATVLAFFLSNWVYEFLQHQAGLRTTFYFAPGGFVFLRLKIALYLGFVIAAPVLIQQVWWFVSPGLHVHERRVVLPMIFASVVFFFIGVGFALYSMPLFLRLLQGFAPPGTQFLPNADELLGFFMAMLIGFGLVFELPVVLYVLGTIGIVNSRWLYRNRVYWVVGMGILANVLTPGVDPITPMIMFLPLWFFWEATTLVLRLRGH